MLQGNVLAEILDSEKRYSLEDTDQSRRRAARKQGKIPVSNEDAMGNAMMAYDADVAYSISVPKAHAVADADSILGTSHIEYDIEITRTTDNECHKVTKRFRDVNDFYNQLVASELISNDTGLAFPSKGMGFGEAVDPESAYVVKRKVDLQSFLRRLFGQNPQLYDHPRVFNYFELSRFSFEARTASRFATNAPQLSSVFHQTNMRGNSNLV